MFGLFVCRSEHVDERGQSSGPHRRENAPSWPIIIGFTIVFLATYPLHMYVAEVYLSDPGSSFAFLIAKVLLEHQSSLVIIQYISMLYIRTTSTVKHITFLLSVLHRVPLRYLYSNCDSLSSKRDTSWDCNCVW